MRMTIKEAINQIDKDFTRSAWQRGVAYYAGFLLGTLAEALEEGFGCHNNEPETREQLEKMLLNGAKNWHEYSYGGCALVYDEDIAALLCNPSELKRTNNGKKAPNKGENWIDVQARALYQAANAIARYLL